MNPYMDDEQDPLAALMGNQPPQDPNMTLAQGPTYAQPAPELAMNLRTPPQMPSAPQPPPMVARSPADAAAAVSSIPSVQDRLLKMRDERQKVVDANSGADWGGAISAALAGAGAGFQGRDAMAASGAAMDRSARAREGNIANYDKAQDQNTKNAAAAEGMDRHDKNSDASAAFRKAVEATAPAVAKAYGKDWANVTAADKDLIFDPIKLKETIAQRQEASAMRGEIAKQSQADRQERTQERQDNKVKDQDNKDVMALKHDLTAGWAGRSGQAGVVQGKINSAEAAEQLLQQAKTQKDGLDSRQIEELAQSTSKLLGGGNTASARVDALVPHTFLGRAQTMKEYLTGNPSGQDMQAFTDRLADTISREKDLANNQKKQFQIEALPAHARLRNSNPELYNSMLQSQGIDSSMIDKNGRYTAPAGNMRGEGAGGGHPQDAAAVEWAKNNMKDPRAAAILKANGMQ